MDEGTPIFFVGIGMGPTINDREPDTPLYTLYADTQAYIRALETRGGSPNTYTVGVTLRSDIDDYDGGLLSKLDAATDVRAQDTPPASPIARPARVPDVESSSSDSEDAESSSSDSDVRPAGAWEEFRARATKKRVKKAKKMAKKRARVPSSSGKADDRESKRNKRS